MKKLICVMLSLVIMLGAIPKVTAAEDVVIKYAVAPQFDDAKSFREGLAAVKKNNTWGFIDKTGKMIIKAQYIDVSYFSEGLAAVQKSHNGTWGYIDKQGKLIIKDQFNFVGLFHEGVAVVMKDGKYGYINKSGKMTINPQFVQAYEFSEGLAAVKKKDGKFNYIDKTGKIVIETQFDKVGTFKNGMAMVGNKIVVNHKADDTNISDTTKKNNPLLTEVANYLGYTEEYIKKISDALEDTLYDEYKIGFINKKGELVIKLQYESSIILDYNFGEEGLASVKKDGKYGFVDKNGEMAIEPVWDYVSNFSEGLAILKHGSIFFPTYCIINFKTDVIKKVTGCFELFDFKEGLAIFSIFSKGDIVYGFINENCKIEINVTFEAAKSFSEGLAAVKEYKGKWGYISNPINPLK